MTHAIVTSIQFGTCTSSFHNESHNSIPLTTPTQKEHRPFHSTPKYHSASVAPAECFNSDGKRPNQKVDFQLMYSSSHV